MITGILTGAPLWVWPVLALLVYLGSKALRQRTVNKTVLYLLPLLGLLGLRGVYQLHPPVLVWLLFFAAYGCGVALGYALQPRLTLGRDGDQVILAGEPLTLIVILTLFTLNFTVGVVIAIAPEVASHFGFQAGFVLIEGLAAGTFLGRALSVARGRRHAALA